MQLIIDEIISNVRAVDRELMLSADVVRQLVDACLRAVDDKKAHDDRAREERSGETYSLAHGEGD